MRTVPENKSITFSTYFGLVSEVLMVTSGDIPADGTQVPEPDETALELAKLWADEAEGRIDAYEQGRLKAVPLEKVMEKYRGPGREVSDR